MKTYIVTFLISVICISVFLIGRKIHLDTLSEKYETVLAIGEKELAYRSKQLPLFGGGILFYQVRFKDVSFDHFVDKMSISITGEDIKITLTGVRFHVDDVLKTKQNLHESLKTYIPYEHVFSRPLETLALSGVGEVHCDIQMTLKKDGLSRRISGSAYDKALGRAVFDFYIPTEMNKLSVSELSQATLLDGTFSFEDISVAYSYRAYADTLGIKEPLNWMSGVTIK